MLARAGLILAGAILAAAAWAAPALPGVREAGERRRIIIGTEMAYPPYSFLDDAGRPAGYNVDMARAVAEAAGLDIELRIGPWDEIRKALADGKIQAIVGMFQSPQRAAKFDFTPPFTEVEHAIFVRSDARGPGSKEGLRGKAIIAMRGDIMHDYALDEGFSPNLTLTETLPEALRLLSSGKSDCVLAAKLPGLYWSRTLNLANIRAVGPPLRVLPYGFAVGKGNRALLARLSEGLVTVQTTGRHAEITAQWIDPLVPPGIPLRRVLFYAALVLAPLLLSLALALLWSRTLASQVAARTAELRSRNMLLSAMEEVSIDGILVVDERGAILSFNKRFIELWGIPSGVAETGVDENPLQFVAQQNKDPEAFYSRVKYLYAHKDEKSRDELQLKDGRAFDRFSSPMFGPDGGYLGRVWFFRDITERKRAEEALRESEERFKRLFFEAPLGIALIESLTGHIEEVNPMFAKIAGRTKGEMASIDWMSITHPDDVQEDLDKMALLNAGKISRFSMEKRFLHPDGAAVWVNMTIARVEVEDKAHPHHLCMIEDITARKQAEDERQKLQSQLAQSQKIDSVGRLAGGVAHDFNNLLTAIKGYGEFVRDALPSEDPRRADVVEILSAADRAASLTRQLLAFSRRQILSPQVVDINKIVGDMTNMLGRLIGEDVKLAAQLASAPCLVQVDPGQAEQVIMNLTINARDAMPKGGTITVATEIVRLDEGFFAAHPDLRRGPLVCLSVRDTGCGMTDDVKSRIFEPFFTTKGKGEGTGLGLSTVFGIIKQSGAEIEVESAPGRGTTFRIYFPQIEPAAQDKKANAGEDRPARGHETVLVVEDEGAILRLMERALIATGYTVLTAADGREALKVLERHAKPVDLLVTDVVMPGMSGRELAQEIARRNMARRTLFISGYTDDAIVRHGVLEPGLAFLYKPFSPAALLRKLREVLDGPADRAKA
ncbi:MAG: transporter substrate-binding domain-containing protein [Elusimicrobia bacterium]|nr:transporter substrate-binding domain-containing protein [Elusimicrobiota bacterium]